MSGTPPKSSDVTLVIAEEIRIEINKKLSVLGQFVANRINVKDIGPNSALPLAFMFVIDGGEGKFQFSVEVKKPSGATVFRDERMLEKVKDVAAVHILKVLNFPAHETGIYTVDLIFDGTDIRKTFSISHDPTLAS